MNNSPELPRKELRLQHTHWRRVGDRLWLVIALLALLIGAVGWLSTDNTHWLIGGTFYVAFPAIGLIYNHFFLLNPKRDPVATVQGLETLAKEQSRHSRRILLFNGLLFAITSPLIFVTAVGSGIEALGTCGAVLGGLAGGLWFAAGIGAIAWSKRYKAV